MPKVKVSEIFALQNRLNEINRLNLEDIIFVDDQNEAIEIPHDIVDDFRFTGLNNTDFIISNFYKHGWDAGEEFKR